MTDNMHTIDADEMLERVNGEGGIQALRAHGENMRQRKVSSFTLIDIDATLAEIDKLEAIINRIAAQVGHPPIAPGELGIESVAEAVERRLTYARAQEETLDSITPESLQAFAASEEHHEEHHQREAELERDKFSLEIENRGRQGVIEAIEARLASAETCGLCGERETERNSLFICCENCTDIGVSNVPKEVFKLQRKLAEADEREKKSRQALLTADEIAVEAIKAEKEALARLAEANARGDMWERNYLMSERAATKIFRIRAEKAEANAGRLREKCARLDTALCMYPDFLPSEVWEACDPDQLHESDVCIVCGETRQKGHAENCVWANDEDSSQEPSMVVGFSHEQADKAKHPFASMFGALADHPLREEFLEQADKTGGLDVTQLKQFAMKLWPYANNRRCELINLKVGRRATEEELAELAELQALADENIDIFAPLPIKELEAYMREHGIEIPAEQADKAGGECE